MTFHHYYPKPFRDINHNPQDGIVLERNFHEWIHKNYSNYELSHSFNDEEGIDYIRKLYEMER